MPINAFTIRDEHDREVMELETLRPTAPAATCQICARAIKAPFGLIAAHRGPGQELCPGSRHRPFEQGHEALDLYLRKLREQVLNLQAQAKNCADERKDIPVHTLGKVTFFNRLNFSHEMARLYGSVGPFSFDKLKSGHLANIAREVERVQREVQKQTQRLASWRCPKDLTLEDLSL